MASNYTNERGMVQGQFDLNPSLLIEKIIRERIYDSMYWKEKCFNLDSATLCDLAVELKCIGGTSSSNLQVTPFLCLLFKMIQLQPEEEIVLEYLNQAEFKYLTALAAMYIRLLYPAAKVYKLLEPLLGDYRKLRYRQGDQVSLIHMDEFVDRLLTDTRVCETTLPRLPNRMILEDNDELEERKSLLVSASSDNDSDSDSDSSVSSDNDSDNDSSASEKDRSSEDDNESN